MTKEQWEEKWRQCPKARELFEEFNGIILEDEQAWTCLEKRMDGIMTDTKQLLMDVAWELEQLAKRRRQA